jgi:hypothetical protein
MPNIPCDIGDRARKVQLFFALRASAVHKLDRERQLNVDLPCGRNPERACPSDKSEMNCTPPPKMDSVCLCVVCVSSKRDRETRVVVEDQ